ncbi:gyrA [Symbiodinium microadriaticum]|nr:gyrA [Symbiodinium microadriaticum]
MAENPEIEDALQDDLADDMAADGGGSDGDDGGGSGDGPAGSGSGPFDDDIKPIAIEAEMKSAYLDYAMSVIVSRALPDVRDGLKPVHRRILYSMEENGYDHSKPYRKSARIVGDVMGKYHPHGDAAIYDAMVRLAQDFSMRLPLVDGQGNFGSMDGDPPAAMRYTESRLEKVAQYLLDDLDKDTVDFQNNYDDSEQEPSVLPARFPNLLVNGSGGIAVGMATNIPPHNLGEVIDATLALMDNPHLDDDSLLGIVPGPDFPTGGLIVGHAGSKAAELTGRGSVVMRAKVEIEENAKGRQSIIVSEVPYQVNKASLVEKIAELTRDKRIEGISDLRDESDRHGVRVVVDLKRDAVAEVVLNQLYKYTALQTNFSANMLALNAGKPELLNLRQILTAFITFREEVITRRTRFFLGKARDRAHILVGLVTAVANIDEVIALIRKAPDPQTARSQLMERAWPAEDILPLIELIADPRHKVVDGTFHLSEEQARAILELRLNRLTALGRDEIGDELKGLADDIEDYLDILRSRDRLYGIMRDELTEVKDQFATPRRSQIVEIEGEVDDEDLIAREDMVVTVTSGGYIKRVPLSTYRAQRRGGKGRSGMSTRDDDYVRNVFVANTHTPVLFFSTTGMVYKMKVWRLPQGAPQARGKALVNLLPLKQDERIGAIMALPEDEESWADRYVMFATRSGHVRRNRLSDFTNVMANGKIAMKLPEGDRIIGVQICTEDQDVLVTSALGKAIRFPVTEVRVFAGRDSLGVRGIKLADGDNVISMSILTHVDATPEERTAYLKQAKAVRGDDSPDEAAEEGATDVALSTERYAELSALEEFILTITERGFGKRTSAYEYRASRRGGQGIAAIATSKRNGNVLAAFPVDHTDEIMMVTDGGKLIRSPVDDVRIAGRSTQGVTLFRTDENEKVVSAERLDEGGNGGEESGAEDATGGERDPAMERVGLYPGTFDPITIGHVDIIQRAAKMVDRLVVGVAISEAKRPLFSLDERTQMVIDETAHFSGKDGYATVEPKAFDNLLMHFAEDVGAQIIVRGLRAVTDFEYEFQMVGMNDKLNPDIETVFLMAETSKQAIASRLVKEIASLGGNDLDLENTLYMELKYGRVVIALRPDLAPENVAQVKRLAREGFYDGLTFHRVIPGFMAQGGDPEGDGTGGSGNYLPAEFSEEARHLRGTVSMAREPNDINSADSQFFICFLPARHLDGQYTIIGRVVRGMHRVDALRKSNRKDGIVRNPDQIISMREFQMSDLENTLILTLKDGDVTITLRPDLAPNHCARIKELAREGYYDGLTFHRVIPDFMAQTGCNIGNGTGGSGQNLAAEFNSEPHVRGTCSMARAASPDSADAQFFICFGDTPHLDGQYTVWGQVTDGMDHVDAIKQGGQHNNGAVDDPDKIVSMKVAADA